MKYPILGRCRIPDYTGYYADVDSAERKEYKTTGCDRDREVFDQKQQGNRDLGTNTVEQT